MSWIHANTHRTCMHVATHTLAHAHIHACIHTGTLHMYPRANEKGPLYYNYR